MRWGMIVRGEDRGLGRISDEAHRNLRPDRTLLVDIGPLSGGFPTHPERYPGRTTIHWDGHPLDADGEYVVRTWLAGLDVVLTFETWYDHRIVGWAREAGVRTVQLVMPEFWRADLEVPDVVWAPTTWRLDALPESTRLVPVPVALDRLMRPLAMPYDGPLRVLHVAGHRAAQDRNGTQTVLRAVRHISEPVVLTVTGQDGRLPSGHARRGGPVTLVSRAKGCDDYAELYRDQDVLVMPRRYGGLCLPIQEGLAAGLVPVMPDCSPNQDWPAVLHRCRTLGSIATPGGVIPTVQSAPLDVAGAIDRLAKDREGLAKRRAAALNWAEAHSWEALAPLWMAELERAR